MKIISLNIQQQIQIPEGKFEIEEFEFRNVKFKVVKISDQKDLIPERLPIGVIMSGFTRQYECVDDSGRTADAYVYYYTKVEGYRVAILDSLRR